MEDARRKKNLIYLLLFIFFFLILPSNKDIARALVCITNEDAVCRDLRPDDSIDQNTRCLATEVLVKGTCAMFSQGGPAQDNVFSDYGCVSSRGDCDATVRSLNLQQASGFCENSPLITTNFSVIKRKCPDIMIVNPQVAPVSTEKRGCIKSNGECFNVEVAGGEGIQKRANDKCISTYGKDARLQLAECQPDREFPCYFNDTGACTLVKANTPELADSECMALCKSANKAKCYVNLDFTEKCQEERQGPLAGTDLDSLQKTALTKLNPAKISSPTTLISRAINLMTAFIGSIALLLYVVAGFMWMTASGASEQVDKAKKILVWTTLGVVVMLASYMLTSTLFDLIPK